MNSRSLISIFIIGTIVVFSVTAYLRNNGSLPVTSSAAREKNIEDMKQHFMKSLREVHGSVTDVFVTSAGLTVLTIETKIPDPTNIGTSSNTAPALMKKTIRVSITDKTSVEGNHVFKNGESIKALLDRGVYEGTDFNALSISLYSRTLEIKKKIEYTDTIQGTIQSIGKNSFVIKAEVPDLSKTTTLDLTKSFIVPRVIKNYTVTVDNNTNLYGITFKDLKKNDRVSVWGTDNLLSVNSFTATRLLRD